VRGTAWGETNILRNLKRKMWGDMAYYIPTVWKTGRRVVSLVPHLITPMVIRCCWYTVHSRTGLPDWLFWRQISQIWLFLEAVGVKKIVWFLALSFEYLNIWLFWRQLAHTALSDWCFGFSNVLLKSVIRLFYPVISVFSQTLSGNP